MTKKIQSPADLKALREKAVSQIDLRAGAKDLRVTVHMGTCGIAAGARDVLMELMKELSGASGASVSIQQAGCAGLCDQEPMVTLTDKSGGVYRYGKLTRDKVRTIVAQHVLRGMPVKDLILNP
jgi:NADP-reducing hydrogenase subunit HndB